MPDNNRHIVRMTVSNNLPLTTTDLRTAILSQLSTNSNNRHTARITDSNNQHLTTTDVRTAVLSQVYKQQQQQQQQTYFE